MGDWIRSTPIWLLGLLLFNCPTGGIHESQEPMQLMLARRKANRPPVYQRLLQQSE